MDMWIEYDVKIALTMPICGGIPKDPELIKRWQESLAKPSDTPAQTEAYTEGTIASLGDQVLTLEDDAKGMWTGFCSDDRGLYIESRIVKAMLKESANIVKVLFTRNSKVPFLRSLLAERLYVHPARIRLGARTKPDGTFDQAIHVMTRQGPRSALKRVDYVDAGTEIEFTLKVLNDARGTAAPTITTEIIEAILEHASENGLGSGRSQGYGTFDVLECKMR